MIRIDQLTDKDVGRKVIYGRDALPKQEGTLSSWNDTYVFVKFKGPNGEACRPTAVSFAIEGLANDCPDFKFVEFNPRRKKQRGAEAARVEADGEWMWMSKNDIKNNIRDFGPHPELLKALEAYK